MKSIIIDIPKGINTKDQEISFKELHDIINTASEDQSTTIKLYTDTEKEYTVIFSWHYTNEWKIDYPIEHNKIHKQCYVTHKQCLDISKHIFKENSLDSIKGFINVPIRHFTLDEMLEFKKEDEIILSGKTPDNIIETKKAKPISIVENLNFKTPNTETTTKKVIEKIVKKESKDDNSFFQI